MIAIIDYGLGNKHSVFNALEYLGVEAIVTADPGLIRNADRLILPGVGAFGQSMENLKDTGLDRVLEEEVLDRKKPFLGICLGMQVLATFGMEKGSHAGLGWIRGTVRPLTDICGALKVPHVGWNEIELVKDSPLFQGIRKDRSFYFVHSYYFDAEEQGVVSAQCTYGAAFPCALQKGNIVATQFHPEKSQKNGLQVLENFSAWRI